MIAAITELEGVSLKGVAGKPWAHAARCACLPEQTFTCTHCGRRVGWCLGASDNMPGACDFCWRPEPEEVDAWNGPAMTDPVATLPALFRVPTLDELLSGGAS